MLTNKPLRASRPVLFIDRLSADRLEDYAAGAEFELNGPVGLKLGSRGTEAR